MGERLKTTYTLSNHLPIGALFIGLVLIWPNTGCREPVANPSDPKAASESKATSESKSNTAITSSRIAFREVEDQVLASIRFQNGSEANLLSILEIVGGGVACFDYDLDGHCDLLFPGGGFIDVQKQQVGGLPSSLIRNRGNWRFENATASACLDTSALYTNGVTIADYDNDGFEDVLLYGYRGILLFRNQGDGTFLHVPIAPAMPQHQASLPWVTAAAWFDFENDGDLDLHLVSYVDWDFKTHTLCSSASGKPDVCSPTSFQGSQDLTWLNQNDGTFLDATENLQSENAGRGLGVLAARMESHLATSLYVANDLSPNYFYVQDGSSKMIDQGLLAGVAVDAQGRANGSMGVAILDYNNDQKFDIFVTNFEHEDLALYQNNGNGLYRHASRETRLSGLTDGVVGFGVVASDFDLDGDEDVMLTSGHVHYHPAKGTPEQKPVMLENQQQKWFQRASVQCDYLNQTHLGRGLATADMDQDGDLDVVITHLASAPKLLQNTTDHTDRHTLKVKLIGSRSNRSAIGAIGVLEVDGARMSRQIHGGGSYLSSSQATLHWGWIGQPKGTLTVSWPDGRSQKIDIDASALSYILIE